MFSGRYIYANNAGSHTFVPMPVRDVPGKFLIAFSLAGEQRDLVRSIAEAVERELGLATVFLDEWFEAYIAGKDADLKLQNLYGEQCELVVVCVSERYGGKPWTLAEYEAIRARQMKLRDSKVECDQYRILPIRVEKVKSKVFFSIRSFPTFARGPKTGGGSSGVWRRSGDQPASGRAGPEQRGLAAGLSCSP